MSVLKACPRADDPPPSVLLLRHVTPRRHLSRRLACPVSPPSPRGGTVCFLRFVCRGDGEGGEGGEEKARRSRTPLVFQPITQKHDRPPSVWRLVRAISHVPKGKTKMLLLLSPFLKLAQRQQIDSVHKLPALGRPRKTLYNFCSFEVLWLMRP